jgi:rubrerythrin
MGRGNYSSNNHKKRFLNNIICSIEAEYVLSKFYNFIAHNTKNEPALKISFRLEKESNQHKRLLEEQFRNITGATARLDISKFKSSNMEPQSFTLIGAIKRAIETEDNAHKFYKSALKLAGPGSRRLFKKLVADKHEHCRALKKELGYIEEEEEISALRVLDFDRWLHQFWK